LAQLRRRAGLTTEELARRAGVSYHVLAAHQRRGYKYGWRGDNLLRVARVLAEALGMEEGEVARLLMGEGDSVREERKRRQAAKEAVRIARRIAGQSSLTEEEVLRKLGEESS